MILTSETFSHTSPSKRVFAISHMWFGFFYNIFKFDIINLDIPFCKRGHNLETEVKLTKASWNVGADFHLILTH